MSTWTPNLLECRHYDCCLMVMYYQIIPWYLADYMTVAVCAWSTGHRYPINKRCPSNAGVMLARRLRRRASITPALGRLVFGRDHKQRVASVTRSVWSDCGLPDISINYQVTPEKSAPAR